MNDQLKRRRRRNRFVMIAVGVFVLAVICVGGWIWMNIEARSAAHRGLVGTWVDDTGHDVSYQFRRDGVFMIRQKLPGTLAPFSGDPGIEHRRTGTWTRKGPSIYVQTDRNWGFELTIGEDGVLRGERFDDIYSAMGGHSQSRTPVILTRKP